MMVEEIRSILRLFMEWGIRLKNNDMKKIVKRRKPNRSVVGDVVIYFLLFLFRGKFDILYYLLNIMIPELVYTMVVTIFLYFIILKINQKLETIEKRSAVKFV